jgi:hypothetical protein
VTDESFIVKTTRVKDIITLEQTLRDTDEAAGGIILMPCNPTYQILGIHIKSDKPQPGINFCTWELLTAVMGLHLIKFIPSVVKGHSGCMSTII